MPQMVDIFIYNNDGSILYGGDGFGDLPFDIGIQKDRLTGDFGDAQNGATLDGGTLILPVNILGLTMVPGKTTPDTGASVGDTLKVSELFGDSFSFYIVPSDEPEPVPTNPKSVSDSNLARFKDKCDETYAPMSRALPAPAGTTDAGKVPTVNSAGNGYTLQTPSGGGKQLYAHYITMTSDALSSGGINVNIRCCIINDSSTAFSYDIMYYFRNTANVPITGYIGISNVYYTAVRYYSDEREREFIDYITSNGIQTKTVTSQLSVSDDVVAL